MEQKSLVEQVDINKLTPHPRNYREHPPEQLVHIKASIEAHGIYRNIVVANDYTILAGHGVVQAATELGITEIPIIKIPYDKNSPQALKLLAGDNEISNLAASDDRMLTDMLQELNRLDSLDGTGYDPMSLKNLIMLTRPQDEIDRMDEEDEWIGMPEYEASESGIKLIVTFRDMEDRARFAEQNGLKLTDKTKSTWWPYRENDDSRNVEWEQERED